MALPGTTDINGIASFKPGPWNGQVWTADTIRKLYQNYLKYCTGPTKEFTPWLNLNHKDEFSFGDISRVYLQDADTDNPILMIDATNVPNDVADLVKKGQIRQPSIEFFEGKGTKSEYINAKGETEPGPVLECLSLLGNELPGVRGLPPIPQPAKFRNRNSARRVFGNINMNRQDMIAALQALGVDVSTITDAVPDQLLASVLAKCQSNGPAMADNGNVTPTGPAMADNNGNSTPTNPAMADATCKPAMSSTGVVSSTNDANSQTIAPASITLKFKDQNGRDQVGTVDISGALNAEIARITAPLQQTIARLSNSAAAQDQANRRQLAKFKTEKIVKFVDELSDPKRGAQLTPAMKPAIIAMLEKCDDSATRKFSATATVGTELEERMQEIRDTYPKVRATTGQQVTQPNPKAPATGSGSGSPVVTVTTDGHKQLSERGRSILSGFPQGRGLLAKIDKSAKKA